jgi:enoyl-CoA hydratase
MTDEQRWANVAIERDGPLAIVMLNRPDKLNAMSPDLMVDTREAFAALASDESVRAVVLTGAGRAFSAGGDVETDVRPLQDMSPGEFDAYMDDIAAALFRSIWEIDKPVIAAINGIAVGGGLELALCCDIRIAAEDAKLGQFYVRMGMVPQAGPYLLPKLVGMGKAKLWSFTGDLVEAHEAERAGLVDLVVSPGELQRAARDLGSRLAQGPRAISLVKQAINESVHMDFRLSLDYAKRLAYQAAQTHDHAEAVASFLEKRPPSFTGR